MSFSMMGSGIYSEDVNVEVVCKEYEPYDIDGNRSQCEAVYYLDMATDDYGEIREYFTCEKCGAEYIVKWSKHDR